MVKKKQKARKQGKKSKMQRKRKPAFLPPFSYRNISNALLRKLEIIEDKRLYLEAKEEELKEKERIILIDAQNLQKAADNINLFFDVMYKHIVKIEATNYRGLIINIVLFIIFILALLFFGYFSAFNKLI